MIRLIDLYRVIGRRLTRKLLQAKWIVPVQNGPGGTTFEAEKVHRALGRLTREGYTLLPRALFPPTEREETPEPSDRRRKNFKKLFVQPGEAECRHGKATRETSSPN